MGKERIVNTVNVVFITYTHNIGICAFIHVNACVHVCLRMCVHT